MDKFTKFPTFRILESLERKYDKGNMYKKAERKKVQITGVQKAQGIVLCLNLAIEIQYIL